MYELQMKIPKSTDLICLLLNENFSLNLFSYVFVDYDTSVFFFQLYRRAFESILPCIVENSEKV